MQELTVSFCAKVQSFEDIVNQLDYDEPRENVCYCSVIVNALRERFGSVCLLQSNMHYFDESLKILNIKIAPAISVDVCIIDMDEYLAIDVKTLYFFGEPQTDKISDEALKIITDFSDYQTLYFLSR